MSGIGCLADAFEQSKANMCALDCGFNQNVSDYQFQLAKYYDLEVKPQVVAPTLKQGQPGNMRLGVLGTKKLKIFKN